MRDETTAILEKWVIAEEAVAAAREYAICAKNALDEAEFRSQQLQKTLEILRVQSLEAMKNWVKEQAGPR